MKIYQSAAKLGFAAITKFVRLGEGAFAIIDRSPNPNATNCAKSDRGQGTLLHAVTAEPLDPGHRVVQTEAEEVCQSLPAQKAHWLN